MVQQAGCHPGTDWSVVIESLAIQFGAATQVDDSFRVRRVMRLDTLFVSRNQGFQPLMMDKLYVAICSDQKVMIPNEPNCLQRF